MPRKTERGAASAHIQTWASVPPSFPACMRPNPAGAQQVVTMSSVFLQWEPISQIMWIIVILLIPVLEISFILQQLAFKYDFFFPMSPFQVVFTSVNHLSRKLRSVIWIFFLFLSFPSHVVPSVLQLLGFGFTCKKFVWQKNPDIILAIQCEENK